MSRQWKFAKKQGETVTVFEPTVITVDRIDGDQVTQKIEDKEPHGSRYVTLRELGKRAEKFLKTTQ